MVIKNMKNSDKAKIVRRHIHEEWNEMFRENRLSKEGKELYQNRKEHVERSFADSKQNHGYRYAMYKGVEKNQNYTWLICAAQNMKNITLKKEKYSDNKQGNITVSTKITNFYFKNFYKTKPLEKTRGLSTLCKEVIFFLYIFY